MTDDDLTAEYLTVFSTYKGRTPRAACRAVRLALHEQGIEATVQISPDRTVRVRFLSLNKDIVEAMRACQRTQQLLRKVLSDELS